MAYKPTEKPGIMLYKDDFELLLENFEEKEFKPFMQAIYDYAFDGVIPDFENNRVLKMAWQKMKAKMDKDHAKYEEIRKKRSEAGHKGAEARYGTC